MALAFRDPRPEGRVRGARRKAEPKWWHRTMEESFKAASGEYGALRPLPSRRSHPSWCQPGRSSLLCLVCSLLQLEALEFANVLCQGVLSDMSRHMERYTYNKKSFENT
ncbi:hypothetical protein BHE74_00058205 [Ensete ventricosum]|nr:hypothetical protein GW17_00038593 [Ensete ventricosum]RWW36749.1 hypothetical protein BHE74_00058205 [Ensete ventricosum]